MPMPAPIDPMDFGRFEGLTGVGVGVFRVWKVNLKAQYAMHTQGKKAANAITV